MSEGEESLGREEPAMAGGKKEKTSVVILVWPPLLSLSAVNASVRLLLRDKGLISG